MNTMNISLPESMRAFVEQRVTSGEFSTTSEYIRQLIREDQKRLTQERLESLLVEGLESGQGSELSDQWWEQKKRELLGRLKRKQDA